MNRGGKIIISRKLSICLLISLCIFSSCTERSIHHDIHKSLERAYEAEETFIDIQDKLLNLEEAELKAYDDLITDQVKEKDRDEFFKQTFEMIEKRHTLLKEEQEAIEAGKEQMLSIESKIEKISEERIKALVIDLYEAALARYEVYESIYHAYIEVLHKTEKLYEYLEANKHDDDLYSILNELNEQYEALFVENEAFNDLTKRYNRKKDEYYQAVWEK